MRVLPLLLAWRDGPAAAAAESAAAADRSSSSSALRSSPSSLCRPLSGVMGIGAVAGVSALAAGALGFAGVNVVGAAPLTNCLPPSPSLIYVLPFAAASPLPSSPPRAAVAMDMAAATSSPLRPVVSRNWTLAFESGLAAMDGSRRKLTARCRVPPPLLLFMVGTAPQNSRKQLLLVLVR